MAEDGDLVARLVEQIQGGIDREENFRRIFELYHKRVLAFFIRKGFSREESLDFTQETFFRLFQSLPSFRRESSFTVWFFGIAQNVYKNEIRRRSAEKRDGLEMTFDEGITSQVVSYISPLAADLTPEIMVARQEYLSKVRAGLRDLPPQMRRCCILRYENGLKYKEIADVMDISIETVKAHLHQARKRLVAGLGDRSD